MTTLDWTGPGSLSWGFGSTYDGHPRTIVFDVSGHIGCSNPLPGTGSAGCGGADGDMDFAANHVTIAGQTAPGKGITIRDHTVKIQNTENVIVRYLRMRLGDENKGGASGADVVTAEDNDGIMLDHVSVSWSIDGLMDSRRCGKFTTQWCIFAEPLHDSIHYEGAPHGYLMSWRNLDADCAIHHNLFSSGTARHPTLGANEYEDYDHLSDFRNNVNYNFGGTTKIGSTKHNFINNYFKYGPLSFGEGIQLSLQNNIPHPWGYLTGNVWSSIKSGDTDEAAEFTADNYHACSYRFADGAKRGDFEAFAEFDTGGVTPETQSAEDAYQSVLASGGCSLVRDAVDERIIGYVVNSTGYLGGHERGAIDSQEDVGGWDDYPSLTRPPGFDTDRDGMPDAWEIDRGLDPNDPDDRNGNDDNDGYTNLEEYLNQLAGDIDPADDHDPPTPNPMTFSAPPEASSDSSITMTATPASDPTGVEYYFSCTGGGGHHSGWQGSNTYEDTGLQAGRSYSYTVTTRDKSDARNQTAPSASAAAMTDAFAPIHINFQKASAAVPGGYLPDSGEVYGDRGNGYFYGWTADLTDEARERNDHPDKRYDTLLHLAHEEWEIEVPNWLYTVDVVFGDPVNEVQVNDVSAEDVALLDPDGGDHFDEHFGVEVAVADGRLTFTPLSTGHDAKICFVDIRAPGNPGSDQTYGQWAANNGLSPDPALAGQDNNNNGVVEFFEYALVPDSNVPASANPELMVDGDVVGIQFVLPAFPRKDVTLTVESSNDLSPASWQEVATKSGLEAWSGTVRVHETVLESQNLEITVEVPASIPPADSWFLRLKGSFR